jgi:hypothetical protein
MERYRNIAFQFSAFPARHSLGDGGSLFCGLQPLAFSIQPLAFASVAEIISKFGGTDHLRNAVPKFQEPKMSFF